MHENRFAFATRLIHVTRRAQSSSGALGDRDFGADTPESERGATCGDAAPRCDFAMLLPLNGGRGLPPSNAKRPQAMEGDTPWSRPQQWLWKWCRPLVVTALQTFRCAKSDYFTASAHPEPQAHNTATGADAFVCLPGRPP